MTGEWRRVSAGCLCLRLSLCWASGPQKLGNSFPQRASCLNAAKTASLPLAFRPKSQEQLPTVDSHRMLQHTVSSAVSNICVLGNHHAIQNCTTKNMALMRKQGQRRTHKQLISMTFQKERNLIKTVASVTLVT